MGQCNGAFYRNFTWSSSADLRSYVAERMSSGANCTGPGEDEQIHDAYVNMTGWNPLPGECDVAANFPEGWDHASFQLNDLKEKILAGERCQGHMYLGQVYLEYLGRYPRGRANAGECNVFLYTDLIFTSTQQLKDNVLAVANYTTGQGIVFDQFGDATVGGVPYSADQIWIAVGPTLSVGNGNYATYVDGDGQDVPIEIIGQDSGSLQQTLPSGSELVLGDAKIIATDGANVIATGGLNLIGQAGGNLISDKGLG
jgi:hypothetical protein